MLQTFPAKLPSEDGSSPSVSSKRRREERVLLTGLACVRDECTTNAGMSEEHMCPHCPGIGENDRKS